MPTSTTTKPWYQWPRVDNLGGIEPFGGFPKPDSNIQIPAMYPVTALLPGTVTAIDGSNVAWGGVITIRLDTPLNSLATHTAYLHLAQELVNVGQHVNAGQLIAYNGYQNAQGTQKVPLGFALYNGDHYGFGPAWSLETKSNLNGGLLDPVPLLNSAAAGTLSIPTSTSGIAAGSVGAISAGVSSLPVQSFHTISSSINSTINNVPGFIGIIEAIDLAEQFQPLKITPPASSNVNADYTLFGIPTGIPNLPADYSNLVSTISLPSDAMQAFLVFIVTNSLAFTIRSLLVVIGLVLLIALIKNATSSSSGTAMSSSGQMVRELALAAMA